MTAIIECQNVCKSFGSQQALKNVTFTCEKGEPIALVGSNGAGKTTLFNLLCHYIYPTSGSIKVLGMQPGDRRLAGLVSALPQDAQFDPDFPIHRQLAFFAQLQGFSSKLAKLESSRVLALMELSDAEKKLPAELSHGMRKRAAIAQALIGKPKLVFLDEPTAGIDPANARTIRQQITALSSETTFLVSSHNLQELERLCQTVLYLEHGSLVQKTSTRNESAENFLTLHIENVESEKLVAEMSKIMAVVSVSNLQKNEFVIAYDQILAPDMDVKLLQCLAKNSWDYRSLIKGKTLEDRLFSAEAKR